MCPGVDSAFKNEYQGFLPGLKARIKLQAITVTAIISLSTVHIGAVGTVIWAVVRFIFKGQCKILMHIL
jgi:ABC-type sulfate transport system permease subunit